MNTTATLARMDVLQQELNTLEAQMLASPTLLPAAQDALDDEWEHLMSELEMLTELLTTEMEDTRVGCEQCAGCAYCDDAMGYYDRDEI